MLYMLDTNICGYIIKNKPQNIKEKLQEVEKNHTIGLSSIVVSELLYGAKKKGSSQLYEIVLSFIANFRIYDFDKNSAFLYGEIRNDFETKGIIIGSNDLFIASHAKSLGAILVTNNEKDFQRVEGLQIENWVNGNGSF